MSDWIKLHRSLNDNPLWLLEPFTKAQAWVDMCLNANWKDGVFSVRGNIVQVKRGQIGWSELTMMKRWQWSRNKVRHFLSYLERNGNIVQQKTHITSIVTICNYDAYQSQGTTESTAEGTTEGTTEGQQKVHDIRKKEGKEGKEVKNKREAFQPPHKQEVADFFTADGFTVEEAGKFYYHYDANGWMAGRVKMKSWQSAAKKWMANATKFTGGNNGLQQSDSTGKQWNGTLGYQQPLNEHNVQRVIDFIANDDRFE